MARAGYGILFDMLDEAPPAAVPPRLATEPVVAWRCWAVSMESPHLGLLSPYKLTAWRPRARFESSLRAGEPSKSHGAYAWRDRAALDRWRNNEFRFIEIYHRMRALPRGGLHYVFGRVSLWGRVIEHELGYRAQYAYPYDLMTTEPAVARELRRLYAVDARVDEYARYPPLTAPNVVRAIARHGVG